MGNSKKSNKNVLIIFAISREGTKNTPECGWKSKNVIQKKIRYDRVANEVFVTQEARDAGIYV